MCSENHKCVISRGDSERYESNYSVSCSGRRSWVEICVGFVEISVISFEGNIHAEFTTFENKFVVFDHRLLLLFFVFKNDEAESFTLPIRLPDNVSLDDLVVLEQVEQLVIINTEGEVSNKKCVSGESSI